MVTKNGKPWLCFGVMGGDMQPQGHVQVLVDMIDFGLDVQAAGDAGARHDSGSQTPIRAPDGSQGGKVSIESGIPLATMKELQARASCRAGIQRRWLPGNPHHQEYGTLEAGPNRRKDGAAVGY